MLDPIAPTGPAEPKPLAELAPVVDAPLKKHVIICTGTSCAANGSQAVLETFWAELAARGLLYGKRGSWQGSVLVSTGGSIGLCQVGPAVMVYPDGIWYAGIQPADVVEIIESHLVEGQPVQRLLAKQLPR